MRFLIDADLPRSWGNPSSSYKFGGKLKTVIETARAQVTRGDFYVVRNGE